MYQRRSDVTGRRYSKLDRWRDLSVVLISFALLNNKSVLKGFFHSIFILDLQRQSFYIAREFKAGEIETVK